MKTITLVALIAFGLAGSSRAADLVWTPVTSSAWDLTTTNWVDVNSLSSVAFAQRDNVLFDTTGLTQPAVALGNNLLSPNAVVVEVNSPDQYSIATAGTGKLTNVFSLTKRGSGTLILDADDVITNAITIEAGTLQVGNGASRGTLSSGAVGFTGSVTNSGTLAFNRTGTLNFSNSITGSGGMAVYNTATSPTLNMRGTNTMTGSLLHNGAILTYLGPWTFGSPSDVHIVASTANARLQFSSGIEFAAGCPISITGNSGDSTTRAALMSLAGTNAINGQISLGGGTVSDPNNRPLVQLFGQTANLQLTVNGSVADQDTGDAFHGNFYLRGNAGVGKLYGTITLVAANLIKDDAASWTIYSTGNSATSTLVNNGLLTLAAANALPNAQLTVNKNLDLGGFDQQVGQLWGSTAGIIASSSTTADCVLTVSGGGKFDGVIQDVLPSSAGTRKVALTQLSGAQQLTGTCTYSGPTTILGGGISLVGSGTIPNTTPIIISNSAAIDVRSRTDKTLTLQAAQTLKGDGVLNIAGNLAGSGTIELKANKSGVTLAYDSITLTDPDHVISCLVTYGGTLKLELSGDPLDSTDSFKLFTADAYAGTFTTLIPATPGSGLAWNTSTMTTDGTLRIVANIPTTPTNLTCSVTAGGTQLQVSWPENYTGWTLQGQTNAPGVGITPTWHDVPDSAATNQVFIPIDPANGSCFYRLFYQP
jgi:fibronectin-binding autotransporter adhesin